MTDANAGKSCEEIADEIATEWSNPTRGRPPSLRGLIARALQSERDAGTAKDATIAALTKERDEAQRALSRYTEASSSKTDWCPCCKQGWECAKDDQQHRVELNTLRADNAVLRAECGAWREMIPNIELAMNAGSVPSYVRLTAARRATDAGGCMEAP